MTPLAVPFDAAGTSMSSTPIQEGTPGVRLGEEPHDYEKWRRDFLQHGNGCEFGPFGSAAEWEWVCWAMESQVSLTKLDDLLRTEVVSSSYSGDVIFR
jgi:hypothetical protein